MSSLQQEYLSRHNIKVNLPVHVEYGIVFQRKETKHAIDWSISSIKWIPDYVHPGRYVISDCTPKVDSSNHLLLKNRNSLQVSWDSYESFWFDWVKNVQENTVVFEKNDVVLTAWEIFVNCMDYRLKCIINNDFFINSISSSVEKEQRLQSVNSILNYLSFKEQNIYSTWYEGFEPMIQSYCFWVGNLLKKPTDGR